MRPIAALTSFLRAWLLRSRMERDMDNEMRFHVEARAADLEARGVPRAEAERLARAEFGDVVRWKEAGRESRGLQLVDEVSADLRYAVRMMRRTPGFTVAAIVSLALGIGANTAIFGVMDLLLLRPAAVHHPFELVHVTTAGERGEGQSGSSNYPWFRDVAARSDLFTDAMLERHEMYKVGIDGRVEPITGQRVTTNYYSLLGVPAILGRTFVPADAPDKGGSPVAVISYRLWQRRWGGAVNVIGSAITVNQQPYTIIGVTPPEFRGLLVGWTMDVTMPLDPSEFMDAHSWSTMPLIARVKPGVDVTQLGAQLDPMLKRITSTGVSERFRRRYLERASVASAARGISELKDLFSRPLRLLMGAVGLLLLIASVNLAGLLIARNAARQHELGIRMAIGAGRRRIVQQLLTESALLALLGAIPGVWLALYGSNLLLEFTPDYFGHISATVTPDWRLLTFALSITVATTLMFSLVPAWHAVRLGAAPGVTRATARTSTSRLRLGRAIVVAQVGLSLVLVAGATLLLRTLLNLSRVDTGFNHGVVLLQIDPEGTPYSGERLRVFQKDMLAALANLPGVRHVSLATSSPFNGNVNGKRLTVPGVEPRSPDDGVIQVNLVAPSYFDALQVPILAGRAIDARDEVNAPRVAVVSDSFARRYFGGVVPAIGRQFVTGGGASAITYEIVGVARDVRYQNLRTPSDRLAYVPWFQQRELNAEPFEFVIKTDGDPANWINIVRAEMQRLRPDAPILTTRTMTQMINDRLLSERLLATLGVFFAIVALTLVVVGVYGLLAHLVAKRVPEIGVRLALGARPGDMMWMMLRHDLALAAIGSAIGVAAAVAALRVLDGLVFGLSTTDVTNILGAAVILMIVSVAAALVPARRAASVDPIVALRFE
jgi:putative ABC transport system permease protein